jgi:hypothetical protein
VAWKYRLPTQSIKTQTYMQIKNLEYKMQVYLRCLKDSSRRHIFARLRTGSHWLQVQVGSFQGTDRSSSIYEQCSSQDMEDEEHWLLK